MANFYYKAKSQAGETNAGIVQAPSEDMAVDILADRGLVILWMKEVSSRSRSIKIPFIRQVPIKDQLVFSRQLSVLVSANVPLVQALKTMIRQTENKKLKVIISELADAVEGGLRLSDSLAKYPDLYDDFYVNIIRSGETSGKLDEVLNYLADQQEKDYDLKSRIKGAMIYPLFILIGLVVVGVIMMIFVIPKITNIMVESGAELPLATQILITVSGFLQKYWGLIAILIVAIFITFQTVVIKMGIHKKEWDRFKISVPVIGNVFKKIALIRFLRSLETLITGGVPLPKGLRITANVVDNLVFKDLIIKTIKEVEAGSPIASVFSQSKDIPYMASQMMIIGEKTGKLDKILVKLTNFYTREVDNLVRNLVTLIEPIVMILMGVAVGIMVAAVLMPMYNLAGSI